MTKKSISNLIISLIIFTFALSVEVNVKADEMNTTVKITSYKELFTGQIIAFGSGSGTIVDSSGLIISNHHVIFDNNEQKPLDTFKICITFNVQEEPSCKYTARLIAHDKNLDISLLQINEKDIFGKYVKKLQHLNYINNANPKEESKVQVEGYPGSGGDTITITKGHISGFDNYNGHKYFKTDTDFDHGSSGGTVIDSSGNFIGIPTYIRSYAENVGYFLDIKEALPWIKENKNITPIYNKVAENRLKLEMARLEKANKNLEFKWDNYPEISIKIPSGWEFVGIEDDGLFAEQKKLTDPVGFEIYMSRYQFEIDRGYLDAVNKELAKIKERYPDYKQENIKFNGKDAISITYTYFNTKEYTIYIPYGHTLISLRYSINLDEKEKQLEIIEKILKEITINSNIVKTPNLENKLEFKNPMFSVEMPNNWKIRKNSSNSPINLLAEAVQEFNYDGQLSIYYNQIPKDAQGLKTSDRADEETKRLGSGNKLISKKGDVIIDGLKGFIYTYEYEGSEFQEMHKKMTLKLQDGDFEYTVYYDDLSETFDKNLKQIEKILKSFKFNGEKTEVESEYNFGSFIQKFSDIKYHRFANAISNLAEKEIINGYDDGTFKPEKLINRSEALKIILESKNQIDKQKELGNEIDFHLYNKQSKFKDVSKNAWFNIYVNYAKEKNIIADKESQLFKPNDPVTIAEALKIIYGTYEIPLWNGDTDPWFKLYMDKGYELGLIPRGMDNPGQKLTRAELSFIVNDVYTDVKNSSNFYY